MKNAKPKLRDAHSNARISAADSVIERKRVSKQGHRIGKTQIGQSPLAQRKKRTRNKNATGEKTDATIVVIGPMMHNANNVLSAHNAGNVTQRTEMVATAIQAQPRAPSAPLN